MAKAIRIGDLRVAPAEKKAGFLKISGSPIVLETPRPPRLYGNLEIPVMVINGSKPGPILSLTAGHHGCEYPGIQAAIDTYVNIHPEELSGSVIIAPIVNTEGFRQKTMYVNPIDGLDINELYPGKQEGSRSIPISYRIARTVFENVALVADYLIDLHGGDYMEAIPSTCFFVKTGNKEVDSKVETLARVYGTEFIMGSGTSEQTEGYLMGESLHSILPKRGKPAFLAESGGEGKLDKNFTDIHVKGIRNVMKRLKMLKGSPKPNSNQKRVSRWWHVYAGKEGIFIAKVKAGDRIKKGQIIGVIEDYHGGIVEEFASSDDGYVFLLMSNPAKMPGNLVFKCFSP
jgi:hypothetical protein